ncbi:GNAT family N-acetyltransferase [Marinobacter salinexigens]|uniref:GNAT family N-acetyltransferase n=1 Tax=Marinobacter salinexigens TaxID=2919747 RepID=A0A5B0VK15_9GAMM|nr:GNAT family N-acetyltransferase [Marinobacter salinexigens]KAA1175060.1 GNAT family N-acetyltransferase [Marinobacter salinexigens]
MSLFQTNAWQDAWWAIWGSTPGFRHIQSCEQEVSGLYQDVYRLYGCIPIRCFQFIGTNYRRISTPRTEYNSLFHGGDTVSGQEPAFTELLDSGEWTEAVFRDVREDAPDLEILRRLAVSRGWSMRTLATDTAYAVDTRGSFQSYLAGLGSNTRLKLYNRRKILEGLGTVALENAWPNRVDEFFDLLNRFHRVRWGVECFNKESLEFHRCFLEQISKDGGGPSLSLLLCGDRVISVVYNVCYKGCVYNLQSGYVEDFHRKIALGTLHLGYCIETAFSSPTLQMFDMLAGTGKNDNYKARLATQHVELRSVMVVRSWLSKILYRLKDGTG